MKVAIDGRAANWYRGTGIGTYTYELIYNLNRYDKKNNYLIFLQESSSLNNFNHNFSSSDNHIFSQAYSLITTHNVSE